MKILLLGDASNYHNALATGLSRLGHDVTLASDGSRWMDTRRNIDLSRSSGKIGGAILWAKLKTVLSSKLKGYDVVQLVNPIFVHLRPHRVAELFHRLKRDNGAIYLTALGTDEAYVRMCLADDCPLRYSEWSVAGTPTPYALSQAGINQKKWLEDPLRSHAQMIYENVDGVVSALYEYHLAMQRVMPEDKIVYGGIPIDTASIPFDDRPRNADTQLRVLAPYHAGREYEKGVNIMRAIAEKVPNIDLQPVTGLKFAEFQRRMMECDVVLDQYYSYTPATTALMAMAMGKIVVTGAEADFERFIGEEVPAFNISPFNHDALSKFLSEPDASSRKYGGHAARQFVEKHNGSEVVARRFVDLWTRR